VVVADIDPAVVKRFALDQIPFERPAITTAELLRLDGKRAIVTGGGGDGLGAAICHRLAEQGADVAVLDISAKAAHESAEAVSEKWDVRTHALVCDVGDPEQTQAAVAEVMQQWGGLDILVNNAGGSGSIGPDGRAVSTAQTFATMTTDDLMATVRVNLLGVMLMSQAVLKAMIANGRGRIINISSEGGKISLNGIAVYNACKSGVIGFTRNLARDVGKLGVSVVCVCPGTMIKQRHLEVFAGRQDTASRASRDLSFERITLGRMCVPDEVASVVAFLASPAGAYVNGTAVSVGGGMAD
jgi:3-oxoacyl-[acyl-carrier protein] reductase